MASGAGSLERGQGEKLSKGNPTHAQHNRSEIESALKSSNHRNREDQNNDLTVSFFTLFYADPRGKYSSNCVLPKNCRDYSFMSCAFCHPPRPLYGSTVYITTE